MIPLPVIGTVLLALRTMFQSLVAIPVAYAATILLLTGLEIVQGPSFFSGDKSKNLFEFDWLYIFLDAQWFLLVAPLAIAVHRFSILGTRTRVLPIFPLSRTIPFCGWSFILYFIPYLCDNLADVFLIISWPKHVAAFESTAEILAAAVSVRLILVFPAIAIDQPRGSFAQSLALTRGHFWRIVVISVAAILPVAFGLVILMIVDVLPIFMAGAPLASTIAASAPAVPSSAWSTAEVAIANAFAVGFGAALSSIIYRSYAAPQKPA